ncbi:MAG: AAA family ATPase, partial [Phaeodactylibacter sp.]|nr:AAA family ATPase [Phaeodactylibacter sp.]
MIATTPNPTAQNTQSLLREIQWFKTVLDTRMLLFLGQESEAGSIYELPPPDLSDDPSMYARVVRNFQFGFSERLILMLSFIPHIYPEALDIFLIRNEGLQRGFTEFGGILGKHHGGFLPTGETAIFLLSEGDLLKRLEAARLFDDAHVFYRHNILSLQAIATDGEPMLSGLLKLSDEYLHYFTSGEAYHPGYSAHFPAKRINTPLNFEDLVVLPALMGQLNEIKAWIRYGDTLMNDWGLKEKIKPGYRCLFYGPPGTGKTLSATLIGKACQADVYRIDLSMVVSKYIGETEKN